jgi:hypothetical protein
MTEDDLSISQTFQLQEAAATEEELYPIVAGAITESYFTEWGTRADGLRADFVQVQSIDFEFWTRQIQGLL